jgi:hypothetical protein
MSELNKTTIQFSAILATMLGLVAVTITALVIDHLSGREASQLTTLLTGGLISIASSSAVWLFRSNGEPREPKR